MEKHDQVELLKELLQVDIDTVQAYNRVLDDITDEIIHSRLEEFQKAHLRHIDELSDLIRQLGEQPPEMLPDLKGFVIEAFAALRKVSGLKGGLKALKTIEEIINRYYRRAIPKEMPPTMKDILRRHLSEEKNHLEYIKGNIQAMET